MLHGSILFDVVHLRVVTLHLLYSLLYCLNGPFLKLPADNSAVQAYRQWYTSSRQGGPGGGPVKSNGRGGGWVLKWSKIQKYLC